MSEFQYHSFFFTDITKAKFSQRISLGTVPCGMLYIYSPVYPDLVFVFFCTQICADPAFAKDIRLSSPEHGSIYHDVRLLCNPVHGTGV